MVNWRIGKLFEWGFGQGRVSIYRRRKRNVRIKNLRILGI